MKKDWNLNRYNGESIAYKMVKEAMEDIAELEKLRTESCNALSELLEKMRR